MRGELVGSPSAVRVCVCVCVWVFSLLCTHICASAVLHEAEVRIHDCFVNGCL